MERWTNCISDGVDFLCFPVIDVLDVIPVIDVKNVMEEFFHEKEAMYQLPMQRIPDWGHYTFHFKLKKKNTKETTILFAECRWLLQGWIIDWRSNIERQHRLRLQSFNAGAGHGMRGLFAPACFLDIFIDLP